MEFWKNDKTGFHFSAKGFHCSGILRFMDSMIPVFQSSIFYIGALKFRSLKAFETTVTDENAMAPAARMGLSRMPKNGKRMPAATGIRTVL